MAFSPASVIQCRQFKRNAIRNRSLIELLMLQDDPRWERGVTSFDMEAMKPVISKVVSVLQHRKATPVLVQLRSGQYINATEDQKLLTKTGFKPVKQLAPGETVACLKTKRVWYSPIEMIQKDHSLSIPVFSLSLDSHHNYVVNGIVVAE